MADAKDIANAIAACKAAFPNFNPDPAKTPEMWLLTLKDLDSATLQIALLALITEPGRVFAPSIGEIRGAVLDLNAKAQDIPSAWQAYEEVVKMPPSMMGSRVIHEEGRNVIERWELKFSHPLVEEIGRRLGWPKDFPTSNPGVDRAQFTKAYDTELARVLEDASRLKAITDHIEKLRGQYQIEASVSRQGSVTIQKVLKG